MNNQYPNTTIANKYGYISSLILQYIYDQVEENEKNNDPTHFHEDTYWARISVKDFSDHFTYFTARQIRSALEKLKENELIISANFSKSCDRTLSYTLTDKAIELITQ